MSDYVRGLRERVGHDLLFGPSAACLIRDGDKVLLVKHVEGRWTFPAGAVDPGERPAEAAQRETLEEAGIVVEPSRIAGVYGGGPDFSGVYSNGDRVAWVTTLFEARIVSGEPKPSDDETAEVRWVTPDEAFALELSPATRWMLQRVLDGVQFDA
ncbi:MAG TPA: NUDIX domain-containing protein [Gaiellaceae bacterium]